MSVGAHFAARLPAVLFARSRVRPRTLSVLVAALAGSAVLANQTLPVPFLGTGALVAAAPLLPVIPAVFVGGLCGTYLSDQERLVTAARMRTLRLCWGLLVSGGLLLGEDLAGVVVRSPLPAAALLRSSISFTGLALLGAAVFGRGTSWLPPACAALVTYVLGKTTENEIRPWAWVLRPDGPVTWWTSGSLLAAGLCAFALLDCRITPGDDAS